MKNKLFKNLTVFMLIFVSIFTFVACNKGHTHNFSVKNVDQAYLATAATCSSQATYYYSCECGEKGSDTFKSGATQHNYNAEDVCQSCGKPVMGTQGLDIRLSTDGTYARVYGIGTVSEVDKIIIPASFQGKPVTEIVTISFQNCTASGFELPYTLKKIGLSAFKDCKNLLAITIPASVTSIGASCFSGCKALKSITLEDINGWQSGRHGSFSPVDVETLKSASKVADSMVKDSANAWEKK